MKKTEYKKAFSLSEMMIVMLILSIVMAAATPLITKRTQHPPTVGGSVPTGTIVAFYGATAPAGWQLCDGNPASTPALVALVGANVPDLRGQFIRGLDTTGTKVTTEAGRTLGSSQADTAGPHIHQINNHTTLEETGDSTAGLKPPPSAGAGDYGGRIMVSGGAGSGSASFTLSTIRLTDGTLPATPITETRPTNVALNYIIKE